MGTLKVEVCYHGLWLKKALSRVSRYAHALASGIICIPSIGCGFMMDCCLYSPIHSLCQTELAAQVLTRCGSAGTRARSSTAGTVLRYLMDDSPIDRDGASVESTLL